MTTWARSKFAYLALRQGDIPRAHVLLLDCLERFQQDGNEMGMAYCIEGLASLAVLQGQYEFAVRLFAMSDATREVLRNIRPVPEQADVDRDLGTIREHLDEMTITAAYEQGRAITLEKVVAQMLSERVIDKG